ncbi:hypothetical protein, partial [Rhizobium sp. UBA1881]|uniref:hypothetical protein n=1 Tax=Rhizobium sp. UBA1881 TaxID=1947375 RepID=UPI0025F1ADD7
MLPRNVLIEVEALISVEMKRPAFRRKRVLYFTKRSSDQRIKLQLRQLLLLLPIRQLPEQR